MFSFFFFFFPEKEKALFTENKLQKIVVFYIFILFLTVMHCAALY